MDEKSEMEQDFGVIVVEDEIATDGVVLVAAAAAEHVELFEKDSGELHGF